MHQNIKMKLKNVKQHHKINKSSSATKPEEALKGQLKTLRPLDLYRFGACAMIQNETISVRHSFLRSRQAHVIFAPDKRQPLNHFDTNLLSRTNCSDHANKLTANSFQEIYMAEIFQTARFQRQQLNDRL